MIIALCIIGYLLMAGIAYGLVCRFVKPGIQNFDAMSGKVSYLTEESIKKTAMRTGIFWPYYVVKFIIVMSMSLIGQLILKIGK